MTVKYRLITVDLNPQALLQRSISGADVVGAVNAQNLVVPQGSAKIGDREYDIALNSSAKTIQELNDVPLKVVNGTHAVPELIATAAREVEADLIVVGTHGWGGFRETMLGSVARGLLHEAFCPVLSIPPETRVPA